jgi:hypothetical protein
VLIGSNNDAIGGSNGSSSLSGGRKRTLRVRRSTSAVTEGRGERSSKRKGSRKRKANGGALASAEGLL